MNEMPPPPAGFFGKLPSRGDFVARSLPPGFREAWDAWLSQVIAESQAMLDGRWSGAFAEALVWRFALGAGVAGPQPLCGILMPSIDNAGRAFPLTLVARTAGDADGGGGDGWFDAAEAAALDVLDSGGDPEALGAALAALPPPPSMAEPGRSLWWVADGAPAARDGLPDTAAFVAFLTRGAVLFPVRSAAATDPGTVRTLNEDAPLDRPDLGLWAVADGLGGMDAGDRASALVVERLGALRPASSAQGFLAEVGRTLLSANAELRASGTAMACTVVALLVFGRHFAAVWAGDSRLYRLRGGILEQLTTDHSAVQAMVEAGDLDPADAAGHPRANEVTRAVGAEDDLFLDVTHGELAPGDRFLLCSDGLTKVLPDDSIRDIAGAEATERTPARLIDAVREAGAPDNVTVVAVEIVQP